MSPQFSVLKILTRPEKKISLLQFANSNRLQGRFNDVTIQCGNTSIDANRMVLSYHCLYFDQIFEAQPDDGENQSVIEINDVDGESLKLLIQYIYTGQICINSDNILNILAAVHRLEINELKECCFEFMENCFTPDNCITALIAAKQCQNFDLRDKVYKYIGENYKATVQTQAFKSLSFNELFLIVFHLKQSFHIIDAVLSVIIMNWIVFAVEDRKEHLSRLVQFISDQKYFQEIIEQYLETNSSENISDCLSLLNLDPDNLVKETRIFCIGGEESNGGLDMIKKVTQIFSLDQEDESVAYPDLPIPLCNHCSLKLNNFVYCIGGESVEFDESCVRLCHTAKVFRLNLSQDDLEWEEMASMNEKRSRMGATVFNQMIAVCGGWNQEHGVLKSSEIYDPKLNKWTVNPPMKQDRPGFSLASLDGSLLALGGGEKDTVERLKVGDNSWQYFSSMQTSRRKFAAVKLDDCIYAIGGISHKNQTFRSVEKFVVPANKWVYVSSLSVGRHSAAACSLQGKIYVVGGQGENGRYVDKIECYDPSSDKWEIVGLTDKRLYHHSVVVA